MYLENEGLNEFTQDFKSVFDMLISPELQGKLLIFKVIFIIVFKTSIYL